MEYQIAVIPGDGIGPEITRGAMRVLESIAKIYGHTFRFETYLAGGCAIDACGIPLPQETIDGCMASDSVLLGAVGGPKWDDLGVDVRPEKALLGLRKELGLYTNLRPAKIQPALRDACVLRSDIAEKGFDLLIVRELTGGIYFGERGRRIIGAKAADGAAVALETVDGQMPGPGEEIEAYDTEAYSVSEVTRVAKVAFEAAQKRGGKVTSIDKANVLEASRLWRATVHEVAKDYPDVTVEDMLVDNAAMQLVRDPSAFDVVVTSNMFGDILSDEASQVTGSIGLLASASLGDGTRGLYEPIHGSAPDIAGKDVANPIATILSAAMMLRYSFGLGEEADAIEAAVEGVLNDGLRTADILGGESDKEALGCEAMTDAIIAKIEAPGKEKVCRN